MRSTTAQPLQTVQIVTAPIPNPLAFIPVIQPYNGYPPRLCALISPSLILLDVHYIPAKGTPVVFTLNDRTQVTAHIGDEHSRPGPDMVIMWLDTRPGSVPCPIASYDEIQKAPELIVTGVAGVGSTNVPSIVTGIRLSRIIPSSGQFSFAQSSVCTLENGDSGSPVFVNAGGVIKLAGTVYSVQPSQVIVHAVAPYATQISALN